MQFKHRELRIWWPIWIGRIPFCHYCLKDYYPPKNWWRAFRCFD